MNPWLHKAKIFAFSLLLFFVIQSPVSAQDSIYQLPAGTKLRFKMDTEINSKVSSVNDTFTAVLSQPLIISETTVVPLGTVVEGRVLNVESASSGGSAGKLSVRFETLRFLDGSKREIEGGLVNGLKAEKSGKPNFLIFGGSAALGTIIGAAIKRGNGAGIGAGIGAGLGAGAMLLRKGSEVKIKTGEEFEIELKKPVTLPIRDY